MRYKKTVWLVAPDPDEFATLTGMMREHYMNVSYINHYIQVFRRLQGDHPNGVIIDMANEPDSTFEFMRQFRSASGMKETPVVILSDKEDENLENEAFRNGADDFIIKPVRKKALIERLKHRMNMELSTSCVNFESEGKIFQIQIDRECFTVYLNRKPVEVSKKEFELLDLMSSQPGKVFSRDEIFSKVWNGTNVDKNRTIDVHIVRLRKKFGRDLITTLKGVGYRFTFQYHARC